MCNTNAVLIKRANPAEVATMEADVVRWNEDYLLSGAVNEFGYAEVARLIPGNRAVQYKHPITGKIIRVVSAWEMRVERTMEDGSRLEGWGAAFVRCSSCRNVQLLHGCGEEACDECFGQWDCIKG